MPTWENALFFYNKIENHWDMKFLFFSVYIKLKKNIKRFQIFWKIQKGYPFQKK